MNPGRGVSSAASIQQPFDPALITLEILRALHRQDIVEHDRRHGGDTLLNRRIVFVDHRSGVDPLVLDEVADEAARIDPDVGGQVGEYRGVGDRAFSAKYASISRRWYASAAEGAKASIAFWRSGRASSPMAGRGRWPIRKRSGWARRCGSQPTLRVLDEFLVFRRVAAVVVGAEQKRLPLDVDAVAETFTELLGANCADIAPGSEEVRPDGQSNRFSHGEHGSPVSEGDHAHPMPAWGHGGSLRRVTES